MKRNELIAIITHYVKKVKGVAFHEMVSLEGADISFFMEPNGIEIVIEKLGRQYPGGVLAKEVTFLEISEQTLSEVVLLIKLHK
jgi:hypothetical protein